MMRWLVLLAVLFPLGAFARDKEQPPAPPAWQVRQENRELAIALTGWPDSLNPLFATTPEAQFINGFVRRPLTAFTVDWRLGCFMCERVPTLENGGATSNPDGSLSATFQLKQGVKWGDGTPVTTEDVIFSWQALQVLPDAARQRPWVDEVQSITARDARTFVVQWKKPRYDYNRLNDFPLLPAHVERVAFRNTRTYPQESRFALNPVDVGLYNGPYRVAEQGLGRIVLVQNPQWRSKAPTYFTKITLERFADAAAVQVAVKAGKVDMVPPGLALTLEQGQAIRESGKLPLHLDRLVMPGAELEQLVPDLRNPVLQDARVRRALLLAINREGINAQGLSGQFEVATSLLSQRDPVFGGAQLPRIPFDVAEAELLLDEAGWKKGDEGLRVDAKGQVLEIPLVTAVDVPTRALIRQGIQAAWQAIGVKVTLANTTETALVRQVLPQRGFNGMVLAALPQLPQELPWAYLHSRMVPPAGLNFAGFANAQTDATLEALFREPAAVAQQKQWLELQRTYLGQLPALPLYLRPTGVILPRAMKGFIPVGNGTPASLWAEGWFYPVVMDVPSTAPNPQR